jgi:hypothetical protein
LILVLAIGIPTLMALLTCCGVVGGFGYVVVSGMRNTATKERISKQKGDTRNKLKELAAGMHLYHETYKFFPESATTKDGKPLLSWRVAILPFVEEEALYKEFHLEEPWDSPHNKALLSRRPRTLAPPEAFDKDPTTTYFQVITGPDTLFPGGMQRMRIQNVMDGTSNTFLVVDAASAVPWTKPDDLSYTAAGSLPKFSDHFSDGFYAAMADGAVHFFRPGTAATEEKNLRGLITRAGAEMVTLPERDDQ